MFAGMKRTSLSVRPQGHSLWGGIPQQPSPELCCEHRDRICLAFSCHRYRYYQAQSSPEGCSAYPDLPWPCGSYETSSKPSDTRYPDHIGADEQRNPWFGWPPERWPQTSLSEAFGSCERWYWRSMKSDDYNACTDIFGAMESDRLGHGYSEGSGSHPAICA